MSLLIIALTMSLSGASTAAGSDARPGLELQPKAALVAAPHAWAPFVMPAEQPRFRVPERPESRNEGRPSACESDRAPA
jgi:hypothetical protein